MAKPTHQQADLDKHFTNDRSQGRLYVVTGGTSGIGLATTERLCNDGATVAIFARNQDRGKEVESRLQAEGYTVRFYSVDVSREEECERGVQEVVRDFGDVIHGLVNNAGILRSREKGEDVTAADLDEVLNTNLKGAVFMTKSSLACLERAKDGAVVNISSIAGTSAANGGYWEYSATKAGLISLTKAMALDLHPYGIRVNCVSPGPIWTDMSTKLFNDRSKWEPILGKMTMMKRCGEPSEAAATIAFMLSKDASFITGANLFVDGGSQAMCPPVGGN